MLGSINLQLESAADTWTSHVAIATADPAVSGVIDHI